MTAPRTARYRHIGLVFLAALGLCAGVLLLAPLLPFAAVQAAPRPQSTQDDAARAAGAQMYDLFLTHRYIDEHGQPRIRPMTSAEDQMVGQTIENITGPDYEAYWLSADQSVFDVLGTGQVIPFADGNGPGSPGAAGLEVRSPAGGPGPFSIYMLTSGLLTNTPTPTATATPPQSAQDAAALAAGAQMSSLFLSHRYFDHGLPRIYPITAAEDRIVDQIIAGITGPDYEAYWLNQDQNVYGPIGNGRPVPFAG